ncbi:hypothetical protein CAL7716_023780 [Calothrix sp. PCC 7716]|nr:hypothetical protein CAL7716_023780 [Calothrix sp. PCC 7716]
MALSFNPSNFGAWELVYQRRLQENTTDDLPFGIQRPRGVRVPYIDPVEIPLIPTSRIFLVGTFSTTAKPTWKCAGYLTQEILSVKVNDAVVFEGLNSTPETTVDASNKFIKLNCVQLVIFPKYSDSFALRFDAVPWLKSVTLAIWEYRSTETDTTEDLIQSMRAKLETIEYKIDNL